MRKLRNLWTWLPGWSNQRKRRTPRNRFFKMRKLRNMRKRMSCNSNLWRIVPVFRTVKNLHGKAPCRFFFCLLYLLYAETDYKRLQSPSLFNSKNFSSCSSLCCNRRRFRVAALVFCNRFSKNLHTVFSDSHFCSSRCPRSLRNQKMRFLEDFFFFCKTFSDCAFFFSLCFFSFSRKKTFRLYRNSVRDFHLRARLFFIEAEKSQNRKRFLILEWKLFYRKRFFSYFSWLAQFSVLFQKKNLPP